MVAWDDWFDEAMLVAGVAVIVAGLGAIRRTRLFLTRCLAADGYIAGYTKDESDGVYYYSQLRFTDASGKEHEIPGRGFQEPPVIGTPVSITYDPAYPANAWISGTVSPWVLPWLIVLIGAGIVIGSFAVRAESS